MADFRIDDDASPDWLEANRRNWEERLPIHLASDLYDMTDLMAGAGKLSPIEEGELGPVDGLDILHLQCRFGYDSLTLAQRGARVTGIDFDRGAIAKAGELAAELGLAERTRFIEGNVLKATEVLDAPAAFDRVYVTWGTICWLDDIRAWARTVAHFLKPGGWLYFADGHPAMLVFDDETATDPPMPGWLQPYFTTKPLIDDAPMDYAADVQLQSGNLHEWQHTTSAIVMALLEAGLTLTFLHEHDSIP
ncbi:MAG: class I SAM-dependent methyltransferase, partial [Pseudomonadota bacterium]